MALTRRESTLALAATLGLGAAAPAPPRRVVSIGQCLDAILVEVADRFQIVAVTHYSRDPRSSTIAAAAQSLPYTHEGAEEVLALRPDLVLASALSGLETRQLLRGQGIRVETFPSPDSIEASLAQVASVASLVGHSDRGEALSARIRAAIAAAAPPPGARPIPAVVFEANGFSAGPKTLIGELMGACGFDNVAARYGLKTWGNIPLERLAADPPRLVLVGQPAPGAPSLADRRLDHPVIRGLKRAPFPERLLYCGGPALIDAAAALAAARRYA